MEARKRWKSEKRCLDERHSYGVLLDVVFNGVAHPQNELVRDHKYQDVSSHHGLNQVWNSQLAERERRKHGETHRSRGSIQRTECSVWLVIFVALTTLGGSLWPGRYFTFSWSVLMISVSLRPLTVSSNTHMFTVVSNLSYLAALAPTILAMAEPLCTWRHTMIIPASPWRLGELALERWNVLFFCFFFKLLFLSGVNHARVSVNFILSLGSLSVLRCHSDIQLH